MKKLFATLLLLSSFSALAEYKFNVKIVFSGEDFYRVEKKSNFIGTESKGSAKLTLKVVEDGEEILSLEQNPAIETIENTSKLIMLDENTVEFIDTDSDTKKKVKVSTVGKFRKNKVRRVDSIVISKEQTEILVGAMLKGDALAALTQVGINLDEVVLKYNPSFGEYRCRRNKKTLKCTNKSSIELSGGYADNN
jgi:hypothetical protein